MLKGHLHAVRMQCFGSCKDIKAIGQKFFLFAYRSHAGVSHWVSTRVCGLCFVPWFYLLSIASHWTIDSCSDLANAGVSLSCFRLALTGVPKLRGYSDAGDWTLIVSDTAWWWWTRLGCWGITSLYRSRFWYYSCSRIGVVWGCGRKDVIRTREFTDQVFDAAGSLQVWNVGKADSWFLVTGGLLCLILVGGLVRTRWWLGGKGLRCMLKEVNTITYPQNTVNQKSEQWMYSYQ